MKNVRICNGRDYTLSARMTVLSQPMDWYTGPFDDQAVLWLGMKVFWWRRLIGIAQIVVGCSALAALLNQTHKERIHAWLDVVAQEARSVKLPGPMSLRRVGRWIIPIVFLLTATFASVVSMLSSGPQPNLWIASAILGVIILIGLLIPLFGLATFLMLTFKSFKAGQRYGPPMLAWLFHQQRFDRSITLITFALFIVVSLIQLYLS